jgi:hypothetical protein
LLSVFACRSPCALSRFLSKGLGGYAHPSHSILPIDRLGILLKILLGKILFLDFAASTENRLAAVRDACTSRDVTETYFFAWNAGLNSGRAGA